MSSSLLLTIGVDEYSDRAINRLSYCCIDTNRVRRIFSIFNIANHFLAVKNQNATKERILELLKTLPNDIDKIFIYYSGHGETIENTSYLYTFDTDHLDVRNTALSLPFLVERLSQLKSLQITAIIDACNITKPDINTNVEFYIPNSSVTEEDSTLAQGLFTTQILNSFISSYKTNYSNIKLKRHQRIRQEIASLMKNNSLLYISGKSGSGKTYFLKQVKAEENQTIYLSVPKIKSITTDFIYSLISEEIINSTNNLYENFFDADPKRFIYFYSNLHPDTLLIIDHINHIDRNVLGELIDFLNTLPNQKIVSSQEIIKLEKIRLTYDFPSLSKDDILEIISTNKSQLSFDKDSLYQCQTYIELFNYIYKIENESASNIFIHSPSICNEIASILVLTGGFIDQNLFTNFFQIENKEIEQLKSKGLIINHDGFYQPHDSLYIDRSIPTPDIERKACEYWKKEILNNKSSVKAVQNYILLATSFSIEFSSHDNSFYKSLINTMQGKQNTYFLLLLFDFLRYKDIDENLREHLCESLINIGRFIEANELLAHYQLSSSKLKAIQTELYWWLGEFNKCIDSSSYLLREPNEIDIKLRLLCSRGIGYFFLGRWNEAQNDLFNVIKEREFSDEKSIYLSYCVLATIQGLRGTDFLSSVNNFIEALDHTRKTGKLSWMALIYGNIGEMLWKAGFYSQSISILTMAEHLAYLTDNEPLRSEITRNLLHAYYRHRQHSEKVHELLGQLDSTFLSQSDNYVKMQIVNSLISHYVFLGDPQYKRYLSTSKKLTEGNIEYQIYTFSNLAIATLIDNCSNKKQAIYLMQKALDLSYKGENWLAMKQCLDDWDETITSHHLDYLPAEQVFQKWHETLEIKLSPSLHHLSRLCEYLELSET